MATFSLSFIPFYLSIISQAILTLTDCALKMVVIQFSLSHFGANEKNLIHIQMYRTHYFLFAEHRFILRISR